MSRHEQFEEWCALAAIGQLSVDQQRQLSEHFSVCGVCRDAHSEFIQMLSELPPVEDIEVDPEVARLAENNEFRERFLARAIQAGYRFSTEAHMGSLESTGRPRPLLQRRTMYVWAASIALAVLGSSAVTYRVVNSVENNRREQASMATSQTHPQTEMASVRQAQMEQDLDHDVLSKRVAELLKLNESSQNEISALRADDMNLADKVKRLEQQLVSSQAERQELQAAFTHSREANAELAAQLDQTAQTLSKTKTELETVRTRRADVESDLMAQREEVTKLSDQLRLERASLDHERGLLLAGRDVTDLMGARNLHIIDVHDADGKGNDRRAFGRVFYTEGKSLIFYAFDLDEKRIVNAKYTFEAWGERIGQPYSTKSLGVLYSDDRAQKRWALRVDDPRQLAEIDALFVTLEPGDGAREKPRGRKVLYAYLGGKANHP